MRTTDATVAALELDRFLRVVGELVATDLGRQWVLERRPLAGEETLARRQQVQSEVMALVESGSLVPPFERPLEPLLQCLGGPGTAPSGTELVLLGDVLAASERAWVRVAAESESSAALMRLAAELGLDEQDRDCGAALGAQINRVLDAQGEVRDDASPRLRALKRTVQAKREAAYAGFRGYVESHRETLGEETVSARDGRLSVLLPSGHRGRLPGLVHGRSATGKSYYFEPLELVETNNGLQQALDDEASERRRLLGELRSAVREHSGSLERHLHWLRTLDGLQAVARFAEIAAARLPERAPPGELRLVAARHPLLEPRLAELREAALGSRGHVGPVVPLDIAFGPDRVLVVTGPNAGGKTVVLKTVGLSVLAAQAGLPIPCGEGTRLPVVRSLVALIGDEQDLLADRSTFSARLLRLKEAWEMAGPGSLILLDETGSGTNPEEGAALAIALLEGLLEERGLALLTTHLTELAAAALKASGACCVAMQLDPATHAPTFRLRPGPPGGSEALALARRLGLPDSWLERAEAHLGPDHRQLRRLLEETEALRLELEAHEAGLAVELADQTRLRRRLAQEVEELEAERRGLRKALREEIELWRLQVERRLESEVERLAQEVERGRRRGLGREGAARLLVQPPGLVAAVAREEEDEASAAGEVEVGQRVRHRQLGWQGVLERLQRGRAEVRVEGKRLRCRREDLVADATPPPKPRADAIRIPRVEEVPMELNLVGQRVEGALEVVDRYLDRALLASAERVRVVHGHGSGRLRRALREHLRTHPAVASLAPAAREQGGDGATMVTLKQEVAAG